MPRNTYIENLQEQAGGYYPYKYKNPKKLTSAQRTTMMNAPGRSSALRAEKRLYQLQRDQGLGKQAMDLARFRQTGAERIAGITADMTARGQDITERLGKAREKGLMERAEMASSTGRRKAFGDFITKMMQERGKRFGKIGEIKKEEDKGTTTKYLFGDIRTGQQMGGVDTSVSNYMNYMNNLKSDEETTEFLDMLYQNDQDAYMALANQWKTSMPAQRQNAKPSIRPYSEVYRVNERRLPGGQQIGRGTTAGATGSIPITEEARRRRRNMSFSTY